MMGLALGCGGPAAGNDAGSAGSDTGGANLLIGTWFLQVTTGPDNQSVTMTLAAGGAMTFAHSQQDSASASDHAGCLNVVTETGMYSASAGMLTITPGAAGTSQQTYSGCTNASDNGTGAYSGTPFAPATTTAYTATATTLTLSLGGMMTTFTRR